MKKYHSIVCWFIILLVVGCGTTGNQPSYSDDSRTLMEDVSNNPANLISLKQLFLQLTTDYDKQQSEELLNEALRVGHKLQALQPDQAELSTRIYRLYIASYFNRSSSENFKALQSYFHQHPELKYNAQPSPHYLKVIASLSYGIPAMETNIEMLKTAIAESPYFPGTYKLLGNFYLEEDDRLGMAIYNLEKIQKVNPEDTETAELLALSYMGYLFEMECPKPSGGFLKKAISHIQELIKKDPNNDDLLQDLATLYQLSGRHRLMEFTIQRLLNKSDVHAFSLVEAKLWNGKLDDVKSITEQYDLKNKEESWYDPLVYASLIEQNWNQTLTYKDAVNAHSEPSVFSMVYVALVSRYKEGEDIARAFLEKNQNRYDLNYWNRQIFEFGMGQIDANTLIGKATNACELTEAHFATGLEALLKGDNEKSIKHIELAESYDVRLFYEHAAASHWKKHTK